MEVPATPTVLSTPTLPPTNPIVVPSNQNTVSPVQFHTPNASPPNPPDKDDGDDDDKANDSDSENEGGNNQKFNPPAAGGGNAKHSQVRSIRTSCSSFEVVSFIASTSFSTRPGRSAVEEGFASVGSSRASSFSSLNSCAAAESPCPGPLELLLVCMLF